MSDRRVIGFDIEWPTLAMIGLCYGLFALGTTWATALWLPLGMAFTTLAIALHSSLSHEVLHGHPFNNRAASEALVFPAVGLFIPYLRFRDTHLAHHQDSILTDPYDDPESNYLDPLVWDALPGWRKVLHRFNNTLLGRLVIGPALGQASFMANDWQAIRGGNRAVLKGWMWHVPALMLTLVWVVFVARMPFWAYLICAYAALSVLKIRTFLEHQAHERARGRTVIIEDKGPLSWMFLNNNLHVVHHMHPKMPWYRLPKLFAANRDRYLSRNDGYYFRSYRQVFRQYFWRAKDPVPHPLWSGRGN
ncbi:fatty acid desaturase [Shimia biformata]|uniref:fatty acid desaturase n=1 Tax=Shimia biformata TaxID=1294299 RepID=UPI00194F6718|nr:fatty acid desaturase [Shimia biformata]